MTPRQQLKHSIFLRTALLMAEAGTCQRLKVGCVLLHQDGTTAGTGWNGALPGRPHCDPKDCGSGRRCYRTVHAERNALNCSQGFIGTAYVTHEPCISCLKDLLARGCQAIYFLEAYQAKDEAENVEKQHQIAESKIVWKQLLVDGSQPLWDIPEKWIKEAQEMQNAYDVAPYDLDGNLLSPLASTAPKSPPQKEMVKPYCKKFCWPVCGCPNPSP